MKKKKKGNMIDMTLGNLSYHRTFSSRKKRHVWNLFVSVFKKILFVVKLS